ncbi:Transglutaminase-like_superfamily protein [Hexamita inflata]|uniref:Transglutaminase-like superfamily protein n=1 Tax=Hexamita inflata TaxID=28002 RepID=A0AA86ULA1_9EUKA|nr:Transglutaminase-like superfamily protein [Hexamita inflata]
MFQDNKLFDNITFDTKEDQISVNIKQLGELKVLVVPNTFQFSFNKPNGLSTTIAIITFIIASAAIVIALALNKQLNSQNLTRRTVTQLVIEDTSKPTESPVQKINQSSPLTTPNSVQIDHKTEPEAKLVTKTDQFDQKENEIEPVKQTELQNKKLIDEIVEQKSTIIIDPLQMNQSCEELAKIVVETKRDVKCQMNNATKGSMSQLMDILDIKTMNQCFQEQNNQYLVSITGYSSCGSDITFRCNSVKASLLKYTPEIIDQVKVLLKPADELLMFVQFPALAEVTEDMQQKWLELANVFIQDAKVRSSVSSSNYTYIWTQNILQLRLKEIKQLQLNDKIIIQLSKKANRFHSKYIPNKIVFDQIVDGLQKLNQNILIELSQKFTQSDLQKTMAILEADYPEFWFISKIKSNLTDNYICDLTLFEGNTPNIIEQNTAMMKEVEQVEKYLNEQRVITKDGKYTPAQIIAFERTYIDLMLKSTVYEKSTNPAVYNAYGCFVDKKCVCQGYTTAFQLICDRIGLKVLYVSGEAITDEHVPHAWNMIEIEGAFYHIDVTWCITTNSYKYINIDDAYCYKEHKPDLKFFQIQVCKNNKYNYYQYNNRLVSEEGQFEKIIARLTNGQYQIFFQNILPETYFGQNYNDFCFGLQYDNKINIEISDIKYSEDLARFKIEFGQSLKTEIDGPGEYLLKISIDEFKKSIDTRRFSYNYSSSSNYIKVTISE